MKKHYYVLALLCFSSNLYAADYDVTKINSSYLYTYSDPQINNNRQVVFSDGSLNIQLYNADTETLETVSSSYRHNSRGYKPQINNNGEIVWFDYDGNYSLFHYDPNYDGNPSSFTPDRVIGDPSLNSTGSYYPVDINDHGDITWRATNGYVVYYDNTEKVVRSIQPDVGGGTMTGVFPQISNNRDVVCRQDWNPSRISYYNADYTGGYTPGMSLNNRYSDSGQPYSPYRPTTYINNNGDVLWTYNGHIFLYDGDSTSPQNDMYLSSIANQQINSSGSVNLNNNGDVVWYDNFTHKVMYFNNDLKTVTAVSDTVGMFFNPKVSDNGDVIWGTVDWKLYVYNKALDKVIYLGDYGNNSYRDCFQINDNGDIVWRDVNDIYLATLSDVSAVPEPLSIILLGLGLGISWFRKKFRNR